MNAPSLIPWNALKNPVYSHDGWSVKDACMIEKAGLFYLFFSAFYWEDGQERSHLVGIKTPDFITWSEPLFNWRGEEGGWLGLCSPNITEVGGIYYLTYNAWGDQPGQPNQLFFARSTDLDAWVPHQPLAPNLTSGARAIDAAVFFHHARYYLVWKEFQVSQVAVCDRMEGNWTRLGQAAGYWFENSHFIELDGKIHLVLTVRDDQHRTAIAAMAGDGSRPEDWIQWDTYRTFQIPTEAFNTYEQANAGFLADWREREGFFYLLYAGTTEGQSHAKRGDNRLGLARSRDLIHWVVPPD